MEIEHLELKLARATSMPILPNVTAQVCNLLDNPNVTAMDYERIVSQDAALASKILRAANSTYYRTGAEVTTIHRAVIQLGHRTLRSICMTIAMQSVLEDEKLDKQFPIADFWRHSLAVACASKVIARMARLPQVEEAFVAGLLHDIGKLALWMFLTDSAARIYEIAAHEGTPHFDAEKAQLGVTHQEIGRVAAERWKLPAMFYAPIAWHHNPLESPDGVNMLTAAVHVGNTMADEIGHAFSPPGEVNRLHWEIAHLFGIEEEQYEVVREVVRKTIDTVGRRIGV